MQRKKVSRLYKLNLKRRFEDIIQTWEDNYLSNNCPDLSQEDYLEARKNLEINRFIDKKISEIVQRRKISFWDFCLSCLIKVDKDKRFISSDLKNKQGENRDIEVSLALAKSFQSEEIMEYISSIDRRLSRGKGVVDFLSIIIMSVAGISILLYSPISNYIDSLRVVMLFIGAGLVILKSLDKVASEHMEFKAMLSKMAIDETKTD